MKFFSTNKKIKSVSLKQAVLDGFAPDGGLYLPEALPLFSMQKLKKLKELSLLEVSIELCKELFSEDLPLHAIESICERTFDFPIPFLSLSKNMHFAELFHGPTFSFKDFGARFLAGLLHHWKEESIILVATSGDTGSAIGHAFYGMPDASVFILFPKGKVTSLQEKQLTSMGRNIHALEIDGGFEECQSLVRMAVLDPEIRNVTTGNSINIGRIFPQALYFFYSFLQLTNIDQEVILSIPCGNFGHLVSAIFAKRMGLPVLRFLAATNINDEIPLFLKSGVFQPHPAFESIAVSMNVGNPSNFPRLMELYQESLGQMQGEILGVSFSDEEIIHSIHSLYEAQGYLLDPHSAIGYLALKEYLSIEKMTKDGIFFATAHPAKFKEKLSFAKVMIPEGLKAVENKPKFVTSLPKDYPSFKEFLLKNAYSLI